MIKVEPVWSDEEKPGTPEESLDFALNLINTEWTPKLPIATNDAIDMWSRRFDGPIFYSDDEGDRFINPELLYGDNVFVTDEERERIKERRFDILKFLWEESGEPYIKILKEGTLSPGGDKERATYKPVRYQYPQDRNRSCLLYTSDAADE